MLLNIMFNLMPLEMRLPYEQLDVHYCSAVTITASNVDILSPYTYINVAFQQHKTYTKL
jgi:hypothetical protein